MNILICSVIYTITCTYPKRHKELYWYVGSEVKSILLWLIPHVFTSLRFLMCHSFVLHTAITILFTVQDDSVCKE